MLKRRAICSRFHSDLSLSGGSPHVLPDALRLSHAMSAFSRGGHSLERSGRGTLSVHRTIQFSFYTIPFSQKCVKHKGLGSGQSFTKPDPSIRPAGTGSSCIRNSLSKSVVLCCMPHSDMADRPIFCLQLSSFFDTIRQSCRNRSVAVTLQRGNNILGFAFCPNTSCSVPFLLLPVDCS